MTTFAFLILPIHGHLNPTFPVACELIRRGQRVTYWVPEQFRPAAEATGAAVRTYMARPLVSVSAGGSVSAIAAMLLEDPSPVLDQLVPRVRSEMPDVVVHDSLCLWSILARRGSSVARPRLSDRLTRATPSSACAAGAPWMSRPGDGSNFFTGSAA